MAKRKRKRKTYDDKFRTNAVLMAETLGYPDNKGALAKAAKHMKIPHSTLSRWARGKQNPPPSQLVHEKRFDLLEAIKEELQAILGEMPDARKDADYRELATAFGIFFDKHQILQGEPTGIIKVVQMIQEGRVKPDQVRAKWPNLADELFVRAGVDVDGT